MESPEQYPWFALHIKTREEKEVERLLKGKGLVTFLPTYEVIRLWSDRKRKIEMPLFPGYLFCRVDINNRLPVLRTPGVLRIVGSGSSLTPVDPAEIEAVEKVMQARVQCEPWPYLEVGRKVRISEGALRGVEGILLEIKKQFRLVISVHLLQRSVALELPASAVETAETAHTTAAIR